VTTDPLAPLLDLADVAPAFEAAREAVDAALRHRALRRQGGAVAAEVSLRAAVASAALEGNEHDIDTVRAGAVADPVLQGALRVAEGVFGLVDIWPRAPRQVLARLHLLAARGVVPDAQLGRLLTSPAESGPAESGPAGSGPAGSGPARSGAEVARRLDALAGLVAGNDRTPPLLLAAIVHAELITLRPFAGPAGVVARAAARITLISRGFDPRGLVGVEVGHFQRAPEYVGAAGAYATGTPDGLRSWLRHYASAIEVGAAEIAAIGDTVLTTA
jgi:hypothetical protein